MASDIQLDFARQDKQDYTKIKHDDKVYSLDPQVVQQAQYVVDKIWDSYLNEKITVTKAIWWIITHPERDIKILYHLITIIGLIMGNFKDWVTTIPAIMVGLLGILAALGVAVPATISGVISGAFVGIILLVTDWNEFKKNFKAYTTSIGTLLFGLLNWFHVLVLPENVVMAVINFMIFIIGSFFIKSVNADTKKVIYNAKK